MKAKAKQTLNWFTQLANAPKTRKYFHTSKEALESLRGREVVILEVNDAKHRIIYAT